MMKILFVVPRLDKASTRYRVLQYQPYFENNKVNIQIKTLSRNIFERFRLYENCTKYDVVYLQKKLLSRWDFFWIRKFSNILCYDFDDAIIFPDSGDIKEKSINKQNKFSRIVKNSNLVVSGNCYLSQLAKKHGATNVKTLNTPIDLQRYHVKEYLRGSDTITIGWIGSKSTIHYLDYLRPVLEKIGKKFPQVKLKIISDHFVSFEHIPADFVCWNYEQEIDQLNTFDIGIMPLTDDVWTRGKCGFKLLQYMGVGIPAVCHPVGLNREIVVDGETGLWAATDKEWFDTLSELIENKSLRSEMGRKGRARVSKLYSAEVNAKKLLDLIYQVKLTKTKASLFYRHYTSIKNRALKMISISSK